MYTADASAHGFNNTIYIYPSHDIDYDNCPYEDGGGSFKMRDYHVFSMPNGPYGPVYDHGVVLDVDDIPWAARQLWARMLHREMVPTVFTFLPSNRMDFLLLEWPIQWRVPKYSIDPAVLEDDDGEYYMYFGGIWGGQLQQWSGENKFIGRNEFPNEFQPQIPPRVARLSDDMQHLAEEARLLLILNEHGKPIRNGDQYRRFFEASWVHKYNGNYYFSYSTGPTHRIVYAASTSLYGPFQYRGILLKPVSGWTTHHSVVEYDGHWYLFPRL